MILGRIERQAVRHVVVRAHDGEILAALADFDNDGLLDLYEANGKVQLSGPTEGDGYAEPSTLFRGTRQDGVFRFTEVAPADAARLADGSALIHTSRGVAAGDLDGDGGVDLVVANRDAPPYVLMNRARRGRRSPFPHANATAFGAPHSGRSAGSDSRRWAPGRSGRTCISFGVAFASVYAPLCRAKPFVSPTRSQPDARYLKTLLSP